MPKILIIDDEKSMRALIHQALALEGFEVLEAEDGMLGLELARKEKPDVVICDVHMDGLDGYQVVAELRKDPAYATTQLILMTGQPDLRGMRQGMTLGADDYLPKPFRVPELLAAVTNRLHKQQSLREQSDEKLASLRSSISMMLPHELLTPLTGILGGSELLSREAHALTPDKVAEMAEVIHQSGLRLQRLIQNFLIYAQIELLAADPAKLASLSRGSTHAVDALLAAQAERAAALAGRGPDLKLNLAPVNVALSEDHLRKIAHELVTNAFKFSKEGTPVVVTATVAEPFLKLEVRDSGRGMSPEAISQIGAYMQFERKFYEQQGTGLGLTIAKRLVELYGGHFTIDSELNQGTTVTVTLPLEPV